MLNWYDMPGALDIENNDAYIEKMAIDDCEENTDVALKSRNIRKTCSWIENRNHKKKMIRRFLSMNPAMDFSNNKGTDCINAIVLNTPKYTEDGFYDPRISYNFNTYCNIFLSRRGDLRVYHGASAINRSGIYTLGKKDKESYQKVTNRRIRHLKVDIDADAPNNYAYFKKAFNPMIDYLW